ncbi:ABC transporter ATP-binding protein [Pseudomonas syringae group genomosp. 3]|uniref:Glucose ABC transporter, ATP-binding protein n=6 Tax=Pseudomonas syringae group TaxID=136849 RepID=A0A3M3RFM7_9PSED|nr:sn-glycerol-3-phosphate ABC transporter ATP-binding protein UgpC [Pseudomonas syringae group genomosp. 3]RMN95224.1 Glucose ABC transporter, ATP-binding protein [Pseudomonas syringae pv. apii]
MANLSIRNLQKGFDGHQIIKGIDLDVKDREFVVFVGPSGCGKSTLLRLIAGLEEVTSGTIELDGRDITQVTPAKRDLAMVFQTYALYPHMTVGKNLSFALDLAGGDKAEIKRKVDEAARILELGPLLERKPKQLSGGQRQRVAIGRAIVRNPKIFLFDEPLSNLDAKLRVEMRTEMKLMHQRLKTTTVYVTHDQIEAMTLGDKVAVMKDGIVQQFGTPKQIYNDPANLFVASFIGSPPMNFIPLRLQRKDGQLVALLDSGQARCELPVGVADAGLEDREIILGIRPEQIMLAAGDQAGLPAIRAEVQVTEPTGPDTLVFVTLNQSKVCCRLAPDVAPQVGESLTLQFDPSKVLIFDAKSGERLGVSGQSPSAERVNNVSQLNRK